MSTRTKLADDLREFLSAFDMEASELGWKAARNSSLVNKIISGGDCTTRVMDKLYDTMDAQIKLNKKENDQ